MPSKFYMKSITSFRIIYNFAHLFPSVQKVAILQKNNEDESAAETSSNKPIAHTEEIV